MKEVIRRMLIREKISYQLKETLQGLFRVRYNMSNIGYTSPPVLLSVVVASLPRVPPPRIIKSITTGLFVPWVSLVSLGRLH